MMRRLLLELAKRRDGAALVEFALLSPLIIAMMLGVIQAGMWMQTYNALRSASNDAGRYVTVQYQRGNRISNIDIAVWARNRATHSPYMLKGSGMTTYVANAPNQTISNVTEKTLKYEYRMPSVLGFLGMGTFKIVYSRSMFVKTTV